MAISVHPYLNFPGNAREAMEYYQIVFGGELTVLGFADFGMSDMPADGTMHAALIHPNFSIMASDAMPGAEQTWGGTRNYIAVMGDDAATMTDWFDRLTADGTPGVPLATQAWGDTFGDVKDKYGIEWLFNIAAATPDDAQPDGTNPTD